MGNEQLGAVHPRVLFSNPPWWQADWSNAVDDTPSLRQGIRAGSRWPFTRPAAYAPNQFRFGAYLPFPFFLAHAAGYTQHVMPDSVVAIRDSIARGEDYDEWAKAVGLFAPDYIVIETATSALEHDEQIFSWLERAQPHVKLIVAGPIEHERAAQILAQHANVHAVVKGEYDKQVAAAITTPERKIHEHNLLTSAELFAAPDPLFDEAVALHYWDACPIGQTAPHLQLWTSRGCPFKCIFCVWPAVMTGNDPDGNRPRSVRFMDPVKLEAFIRRRLRLAEAAGAPIRSIYIDDDTANLADKHMLAVCDVMKRIGLPWSAMCRADTSKPETWRAMKDAGCFGVKLGFESGSQVVIDTIINKRLDLAKAADTARWLRSELGMTVHGTFTVGLPGETKEQADETRAFIQMLYDTGGLDTYQLSGTAEIEGTPLHSLHRAGHLDKYAGAKIDENYTPSPDGQKKIEQGK